MRGRLLTAVAVVALCAAACRSHAAEIVTGYDFFSSGAAQVTGKPIGHSLYSLGFAEPVGGFVLGSQIEADQTGRAGLASDRLSLRLGRPLQLGRLSVTPAAVLGYGRGLNRDFGFAGADVSARYDLSDRLALVGAVRTWHSFAVNATPLNSADLPHDPVSFVQTHAGAEMKFNPHAALGFVGGYDFGTFGLGGPHFGGYLRLTP
jgi:hypothetical protein